MAVTEESAASIEQVLRELDRRPDLRHWPQRVHQNPLPSHRGRIIGPTAAPAEFEHFLREITECRRFPETEKRLPEKISGVDRRWTFRAENSRSRDPDTLGDPVCPRIVPYIQQVSAVRFDRRIRHYYPVGPREGR